jgi:osmotically-inducible protein OsmY
VLDDATLSDKVRSILFRDDAVPKGRINVNAERGWIYLRGELDSPELIQWLGTSARRIAGVRGVRNLLHTPGTPAR